MADDGLLQPRGENNAQNNEQIVQNNNEVPENQLANNVLTNAVNNNQLVNGGNNAQPNAENNVQPIRKWREQCDKWSAGSRGMKSQSAGILSADESSATAKYGRLATFTARART